MSKAIKLIVGIILLVIGLLQTLSSMLSFSPMNFIIGLIMLAGGFLLFRL